MRLLAGPRPSSREARCEVPDSVQALIAARLDTLPPGAQEPAPGRLRAGEGLLGGRAYPDGRPRPARGRAGAARARPQGARPTRPHAARWGRSPSTASGTCWSGTSATSRSPAPPAPPATGQPPPGSSARPASGRRTSPTYSPTHHLSALELLRAAVIAEQAQQLADAARSATWHWPASGRSSLDVGAAPSAPCKRPRARPRGPSRARLAPRALGAGRPAAESPPGDQGRVRAGPRISPRAGRARGRRPRPYPRLRSRAQQLGNPRREEMLAEALELLETQPSGPSSSMPHTTLRQHTLMLDDAYAAGDPGRRTSAPARRRARPTRAGFRAPRSAASPATPWGSGTGSTTCAGRSNSLSSRARDARPPSSTTTSRLPAGPTRGRRPALAAVPGRDRLLRAARHHRVRAAMRLHATPTSPRRNRTSRAGTRRGCPARRAPGGRRRHQPHRGRAPCSFACSPSAAPPSRPPPPTQLARAARESGHPL